MTQSSDSPLENFPQRIEQIAELLARSISAFDRHQDQIDSLIHRSDWEVREDDD